MELCGLKLKEGWYVVKLSVLVGKDGILDIGQCTLTDLDGKVCHPDTRCPDFQNLVKVRGEENK